MSRFFLTRLLMLQFFLPSSCATDVTWLSNGPVLHPHYLGTLPQLLFVSLLPQIPENQDDIIFNYCDTGRWLRLHELFPARSFHQAPQVVFKRKNGFKGYNSQQFPTVHFKMHQTILSFTSAPINVQFPPEILGIIRLAHWKILQNFIKPGFSLFQLSTRSDVWSNGQKVWCEKPQIYRNGLHHGIIFFWFVFALHFTPWLHTANILP